MNEHIRPYASHSQVKSPKEERATGDLRREAQRTRKGTTVRRNKAADQIEQRKSSPQKQALLVVHIRMVSSMKQS